MKVEVESKSVVLEAVDETDSVYNDKYQNRDGLVTNNMVQSCTCRARQVPGSGQEGQEVGQEGEETRQVGQYLVDTCKFEKWKLFKAERIASRLDIWKGLTSDKWLLGQLCGHRIEFIVVPEQQYPARQLRFSQKELLFVREEIQQ